MPFVKHLVHRIDDNTYAIEEKSPASQLICYLLIGKKKALLIDTGLGFPGLLATVRNLTELPLEVVNTHAHVDHIGGNHFFGQIWFHAHDKEVFKLHTDIRYTTKLLGDALPLPLRVLLKGYLKRLLTVDTSGTYLYFEDGHIFSLGERDIEIIHTPGHTPGSVCLLDRSAKLLFTGDTLCEWGILLHFADECCSPEVYLESVKRIKDLEVCFDRIYPGHHGFPVEKSYIDEYFTCAERIVNGSAEIRRTKGRLCAQYERILITVKDEEKS